MPYRIEVMSVGEDLYPLLERSTQALNGVQKEFEFHLTTAENRASGITFHRTKFETTDLWAFLRQQRINQGGHRPYIIAFVGQPLASPQLHNLFGSHVADEGLAAVTMYGAAQYVREQSRYCCYYLVRYALSFVNPSIKAHNDGRRKSCYFHQKIFKPDIRESMDSGVICDDCMKSLDTPPPGGKAQRLSNAERDAILRMRQFVSGDLPYAIVMKGGGVKGLAFTGALMELEKHFWFDRHVGTSAGAIAAILLAADYRPTELRDLLLQKNFRDFMDAPLWKLPFNLIFRKGLYPGESFVRWMSERLTEKFDQLSEVPMHRLNGALVYAARRGTGALPFDSLGERKEALAAFAARCSMSIPGFFFPQQVDGRLVFDGGVRNNFPLAKFLADFPRSNFIGLYLGKPDPRSRRSLGSELLDIVIEGEERKVVDDHIHSVVVIDTTPIGIIDFRMTDQEKHFLLQVGRAAALKFLHARNLDDGPTQEEVKQAQQEAEISREKIKAVRNWKRARRLCWILAVVVVVAALYVTAPLVPLMIQVWKALSSLI